MMPLNGKKSFPTSGFSDDIELTQACHDNSSSITMDTSTNNMSHDRISIFIVFVFVLEVLVLVFVSVLEYFLRATDVFPVREVNFSCTDQSISFKKGDATYSGFAYNADIPYEVVIGLSFTVPPFIIIVSEIALWAFGDERQKTIKAFCRQCKIPQVMRRIVRYVGCFLFGLLVTMILTDVTKIFAGRLRPSFLETCRPTSTACTQGAMVDHSVCEEDDEDILRQARLSFPSLHTSVSSFSAFFIAIYLHNVIRNPGVRVMKPFLALSFILLALMCGLARYGGYHSHWSDILAGFLLGFFIAAYICIFVLNKFYENYSPQELYTTLKGFLMHQRRVELKDLYKEDRLQHEHLSGTTMTTTTTTTVPSNAYNYTPDVYSNGMLIPRPHVNTNNTKLQVNETSTDHTIQPLSPERSRNNGMPYHNTFQRDLNRAVDHYRSARDIYPQAPGHM